MSQSIRKASWVAAALLLCWSPAPGAPKKDKPPPPSSKAEPQRLVVPVSHPDFKGMEYHLFVPPVLPGKRYPLIFALHGNGHAALNMMNAVALCSSDDFPVFVVAPQYQKGSTFNNPCWSGVEEVFPQILKEVMEKYPIDPDRCYLAGFSMGCNYACGLAYSHAFTPFPFRAVFLYSTAVPPQRPEDAPDVPYLLFVGDKELKVAGSVNVLKYVRMAFNRMFQMGIDARYHEIPGMEHSVGAPCLEITKAFLRERAPWPALTGKWKSEDCAALVRALAEGRWKEARRRLQALEAHTECKAIRKAWTSLAAKEEERLAAEAKLQPTLTGIECLEEIAALFPDAEPGKKAAAAAEKVRKLKPMAAQVEARRLFQEAWDQEKADPAAGKAAFEALASAHPDTVFGQRAKARLQALQPAPEP